MREMVIPYAYIVSSPDGSAYRARVIGHERADGIWEGVIEFSRDKTRLITKIETTQANAGALEYWAMGLEEVYVENALTRAHEIARPSRPLPQARV